MELDYDRAKEKEKEIISNLSFMLHSNIGLNDGIDQISNKIVSSCISIQPPEKKKIVLHLMTMAPSGRGGGKSTKPGNIVLNIRKLVEAIANGAFAAVSAYQVPWLGIFGLILLWNSLWSSAQVELSENDAAVIWTMWVHRDRENKEISENKLLGKVNDHLAKYDRASITQKDMEFSIKRLEEIKCIK
ncbi:hypothetical protein KA005_29140, partial [bacterium]|nr:hypothetical protein [bacterium]